MRHLHHLVCWPIELVKGAGNYGHLQEQLERLGEKVQKDQLELLNQVNSSISEQLKVIAKEVGSEAATLMVRASAQFARG